MRPSQGAQLCTRRSPRPHLPPPPRRTGRHHRRSPPPGTGHVAAPAFSFPSSSSLPLTISLSLPLQRRHGCPELCRQPRRVNPAGSSRPCPDPHPPLRRAPDSATTKPPIRRPSPARLGWTGEVSDLPL
uniref:Uncharacterized protein n=1 Tax=Triticum urartu TaxID=4572 RepID=A0A8R7PDQ8_TRIUA